MSGANHMEPTVRLDDRQLERLADALAGQAARAGALLDAAGAADLLSVPPSWVLQEARADRIPHVRLGRYVRFSRADLLAWVAVRPRGPRVRAGDHPVSRGGDRL